IRLDDWFRRENAAIDVRFCSEVHDRVGLLRRETFHQRRVADIAVDEAIAGLIFNRRQVFQVARVRELIEIDDGVIRLRDQQAHERRADKSGATRYQDLHASAATSPLETVFFASVCATRFAARSSESNVPASVHQPSRYENVIEPSRM